LCPKTNRSRMSEVILVDKQCIISAG